MKTSNIIIISFATFILAGMLILFVDAKHHKKIKDDNFTYKEFPLPAFSVVVAEKGSDLHVDQSDSRIIKVQYDKNKPTPTRLYEVSNDTLHIYKGLRLFVKCKNITAIIGNKPFWVGVNNFTPDTMTIKMNGGVFFLNKYGYTERKGGLKLVNMGLIATDSAYVEINSIELRNLTVKSNNAEVNVYCGVKNLKVKLENHANLFSFERFETLMVEKDPGSEMSSGNSHAGRLN